MTVCIHVIVSGEDKAARVQVKNGPSYIVQPNSDSIVSVDPGAPVTVSEVDPPVGES